MRIKEIKGNEKKKILNCHSQLGEHAAVKLAVNKYFDRFIVVLFSFDFAKLRKIKHQPNYHDPFSVDDLPKFSADNSLTRSSNFRIIF